MSTEWPLAAFALSLVVAYLATPLAARLAVATDFQDRPHGYKVHAEPTPFLGGAAVLTGFSIATLALGDSTTLTLAVLAGGAFLWLIGTLDDWRPIVPLYRVAAEVAVAVGLWAVGLGCEVASSEGLNLALTVFWVIGVVNAFNLLDNLDGVCGGTAAITAAAIGIAASQDGMSSLALVALALSGACAGFLPHNLRSPARIFLGDGGSMLIGFIVAAMTMSLHLGTGFGGLAVVAALPLVGVPALDTSFVVVSRLRRRVSIFRGGRDHITHRLLDKLGSARRVTLSLALLQATLSVGAILAARAGQIETAAAVGAYGIAVMACVALAVAEGASASDRPRQSLSRVG